MTARRRRRITYPTRMSVGALRLVTLRRHHGYAIATADGEIVATRPHPISGRPIPAIIPTAREALRIAQEIQS